MKWSAKYKVAGGIIAVLAATELTLRLALGLGNPVLVQADPNSGYRFQPNQKVWRFGKTIEYNQYSQRSEPIAPQKPPGTLRILMTGDSVLNGGNPTDQPRTITEIFEGRLSASGRGAEVLNASAGSWGIGNQLGYLRKFGTFGSDAVIIQIGTHDMLQPTSTSEAVGSIYFPNQQPILAIQEAWTRYAWPRIAGKLKLNSPTSEIPAASIDPNQQFEQNMQLLKAIVTLVREQQTPVFVLFTPDRADLLPSYRVPAYKAEFFDRLSDWQVPVVDSHAAWSTEPTGTVETYFRDIVHLSETGNQAVADLLFRQLCSPNQLPACMP
ncbi:MAG: SGNH/GDSL hydrolase family protein [Hormoscilla sp.]